MSSFKMAAERGEWWRLCEGSAGGGGVVSQVKWLIRMEEGEVHLNRSCIKSTKSTFCNKNIMETPLTLKRFSCSHEVAF